MTTETKQPNYETSLTKVNNIYMPMIERQLVGNGIDMDDYAKRCVMNALSAINNTLEVAGIDWNNKQLDQGNITEILLTVASLKLNPSANPREVYFQVRNVKVPKYDDNGKKQDVWKKQIEMGIEGDGNDAILARFGRGVKEVMNYWLVREDDDFQYPTYSGIELEPPRWTPKGTGKVVRVVYPIIKHSGVVEFHISEREDVIRNLTAHINNNLMNETFGIAENRFKATADQKKKIAQRKQEILARVEELGLDGALDDEELQKYISPAWKDKHSRESMIIRKMRNNIVKKIPKDFGNTLSEINYHNATDDYKHHVKQEIEENANKETIDIEPDEPEDVEFTESPYPEKPEPEKEPETKEEPIQQTIEEAMDAVEKDKKGKVPF